MESPFPRKPADEDFKRPVAWLLGPQILASLRSLALHAASGGKLDGRDWMAAQVERFSVDAGATEFWFDYLADTGDGQKATYSVAYLCLSDLHVERSSAIGSSVALVPPGESSPPERLLLPRGQFLLIGGDTAYPVATYAALAERVQNPFRWAAQDLRIGDDSQRRPVFGIPGNHDYYDAIDGFNRQFRKPLYAEGTQAEGGVASSYPTPPLQIPGFERRQTASYFAIELPFQWWIWGIDCELGHVDVRQQKFFRDSGIPDKLIVATSEPTTVLGVRADAEEKTSKAFERLGLPRPFLHDSLGTTQCRLDISGDTHHYARYWGPRTSSNPAAQAKDNYASIVSGAGGAFLHPSHAQSNDVVEQQLYPSVHDSREVLARALFNPIQIMRGGFVWLFGALIAFIAYLATVVRESRSVVEPLLGWLASSGEIVAVPGGMFRGGPSDALPAALPPNRDALDSVALLAAAVLLLGIAVVCQGALSTRPGANQLRAKLRVPITWLVAVCSGVLFSAALFASPVAAAPNISYAASFILSCIASVLALVAAGRHASWLFKLARKCNVSREDYWPVATLVAFAIVAPVATIGTMGRSVTAAALALDSVICAAVVGTAIGLVLLGSLVGAKRLSRLGKLGFVFLGTFHAATQLGLPVLLARIGNIASIAVALVLTGTFGALGRYLARTGWRWALLATWVGYGVCVAGAAALVPRWLPWSVAVPIGWSLPLTSVVAGALGAFTSCILFGWYLAVSLAFSGHTNEAGAAAPTEKFKQFIRFRVREHELTGFVIGIDEPGAHGKDLKPRLVDAFSVCPVEKVSRRLAAVHGTETLVSHKWTCGVS